MSSISSRHNFIIEQLKSSGEINVNNLSSLLKVSPVTIRKDLEFLEQEGHLTRIYGGARLPSVSPDCAAVSKTKLIVAHQAANLIKNGEVIFLGSGTTCLQIAKCLKNTHKNLTVVSNNLNILTELSGTPTFSILGTGGQLDHFEDFSVFYGDFVIQFLEKVLVQKAFLTADGVSLKNGYTTHNRNEYNLYQSIRSISENMIFAVEGWKFNKNSVLRLANMDSIDTIVSDSSIPEEFKNYYKKTGKNLYIGSDE